MLATTMPSLISSIGNLPEHGRIRTGVKEGRSFKAIDTFRFTSTDKLALDQLASVYGGTVIKWHDAKANPPNQWQVITESDRIEVMCQPDSVFASYEMWTGGGLQRQCDGETCSVWERKRDDVERSEIACVCAGQGMLECKPKTRMSVIFKDIKFAGTWRYESGGEEALNTLPTMLTLIDQLQAAAGGLMLVTMHLVPRQKVKAGQTRKYTVVEVRTGVTVQQMMAGQARYEVDAGSQTPEITGSVSGSAPVSQPQLATVVDDDDDIVEGELVDDDELDYDVTMTRTEAFDIAKASGGKRSAKKVEGGWVVVEK